MLSYHHRNVVLHVILVIACISRVTARRKLPIEKEKNNILSSKDFKKLIASENDDEIVIALFSSGTSITTDNKGNDNPDPKPKNEIFSAIDLLQISSDNSNTCVVCDKNLLKTGSKRKEDLQNKIKSEDNDSTIITIMNSDIKSCYMVHTKQQVIDDLLNTENDDYAIMLLSYDTKIRKNTIKEILDPKRSSPIILEVLLFDQDDGILQNIKTLAKNQILNEISFISTQLENKQIIELCASSYDRLQHSMSDTSYDSNVKKLHITTDQMKNHIISSYESLSTKQISAISIYQKCLLALTLSTSLQSNIGSMETKPQVAFMNDNVQYLVQSTAEQKQYPLYDVGLNGEGEIIAMSDTGIDVNNCYFWDSLNDQSFVFGPNVMNLDQRKIVQYDDAADRLDYAYGHGTHVAGTLIGHRAVDGIAQSHGIANGIAYNARLAFVDIHDTTTDVLIDIPLDRLFNVGRPNAKIHSASWGQVNSIDYTQFAVDVDKHTYENDDFLYVVAAGNFGSNNRFLSVVSPGTAKNVIAVGASESSGSDLESYMLGPDYIADFSAKGPTRDGRTKPDILAPGYSILSAGAQPDTVGECDPINENPPRKLGQGKEGLFVNAGTSMSAPVVSAALAIIRQYFREGFYPYGVKDINYAITNPSNALLKAVLLNGGRQLHAVDNIGGFFSSTSPQEFPSKAYDNIQNYGLVSLIDSLYIKGKSNAMLVVEDRIPISEGEEEFFDLTIDLSSWCTKNVLSVTIVWMDKPGYPYCIDTCLMNDIDLYITKNNVKYYPNGNMKKDNKNTVERIRIDNVNHGDKFRVHVVGANFEDSSSVQNVALVRTGCFTTALDKPTTRPTPKSGKKTARPTSKSRKKEAKKEPKKKPEMDKKF